MPDDDEEDVTVVDLEFDDNVTPVATEACGRCKQVAIVVAQWDRLRNLGDLCARSTDGRWACCIRKPMKIVLYPNGFD